MRGLALSANRSRWLYHYEKHGLNVEVISFAGSSLAIQAMLSGELPIIPPAMCREVFSVIFVAVSGLVDHFFLQFIANAIQPFLKP